jgi:hypothetical protein
MSTQTGQFLYADYSGHELVTLTRTCLLFPNSYRSCEVGILLACLKGTCPVVQFL